MYDRTARLKSIRKRLLCRKAKFHKKPALLLERLDCISQLLEIRQTELVVGQEINQVIVAGLENIKALSRQLRSLILKQSSEAKEDKLLKTLLLKQEKLDGIQNFPYVVAHEWLMYRTCPVTQFLEEHRGDLVLMSENYHFAVVELKHVKDRDEYSPQGKSRTTYVCVQARKFARFFRKRFPWATVESYAVTNFAVYRPKTYELMQSVKLIFSENSFSLIS